MLHYVSNDHATTDIFNILGMNLCISILPIQHIGNHVICDQYCPIGITNSWPMYNVGFEAWLVYNTLQPQYFKIMKIFNKGMILT